MHVQILVFQRVQAVQFPLLAAGLQFALPDGVAPLRVVVANARHLQAQHRLHADVVALAGTVGEIQLRRGGPPGAGFPDDGVFDLGHLDHPRVHTTGNVPWIVVQGQQTGTELRGVPVAVLKGSHLGAEIAKIDRVPAPVHPGSPASRPGAPPWGSPTGRTPHDLSRVA